MQCKQLFTKICNSPIALFIFRYCYPDDYNRTWLLTRLDVPFTYPILKDFTRTRFDENAQELFRSLLYLQLNLTPQFSVIQTAPVSSVCLFEKLRLYLFCTFQHPL